MKKSNSQNQISITKQAVARILSAYSISDFTFNPLQEGIENTSLIVESAGKKYVLRIYAQERKTDNDIAFEILFQDYLRPRGIPIPAIYPNVEGVALTIADRS